MVARLAKTTFSTGPNDVLAAVDAYLKKDSGVTNAIKDISDLFSANSLSVLKGGNLLNSKELKSLITGVDVLTGKIKINPEALLKGVIASNPDLVSSLRGLGDDLQTKLLSGVGVSDITATLQGISKSIGIADLSTLTGVGSMVNSLSNGNFPISFVDKTGLTSLATSLIKQASSLGIPDTFTAFTASITDTKMLGDIAKQLIPSLITGSSSNLLKSIANSPIGKNIIKQVPNLITEYIGNYKKPAEIDQAQAKEEYETIDGSFEQMSPEWKQCTREDYEKPVNLSLLEKVTSDFKDILLSKVKAASVVHINTSAPRTINTATNTPIEKYLTLGQDLSAVTARQELRRVFPYAQLAVQ
jgi:hypothetical protein